MKEETTKEEKEEIRSKNTGQLWSMAEEKMRKKEKHTGLSCIPRGGKMVKTAKKRSMWSI